MVLFASFGSFARLSHRSMRGLIYREALIAVVLWDNMMRVRRLTMIASLAAIVLLGLAGTAPSPALASCANPVACENALPGDPPSDWQVNGVGDSTIQGFAYVDERERRSDGVVQDQDAVDELPHRHPASGVLRRRWRAQGRVEHQAVGVAAADPTGLPHELIDGHHRLRQLGRVGVLDGSERCRVRHLHRPSGT